MVHIIRQCVLEDIHTVALCCSHSKVTDPHTAEQSDHVGLLVSKSSDTNSLNLILKRHGVGGGGVIQLGIKCLTVCFVSWICDGWEGRLTNQPSPFPPCQQEVAPSSCPDQNGNICSLF